MSGPMRRIPCPGQQDLSSVKSVNVVSHFFNRHNLLSNRTVLRLLETDEKFLNKIHTRTVINVEDCFMSTVSRVSQQQTKIQNHGSPIRGATDSGPTSTQPVLPWFWSQWISVLNFENNWYVRVLELEGRFKLTQFIWFILPSGYNLHVAHEVRLGLEYWSYQGRSLESSMETEDGRDYLGLAGSNLQYHATF